MPQGAFYVFPRCPEDDDRAFVKTLQDNYVLVAPGSGFGRAGYIRLSFCTTMETIRGALPVFGRVMEGYR